MFNYKGTRELKPESGSVSSSPLILKHTPPCEEAGDFKERLVQSRRTGRKAPYSPGAP